MNAAQDVRITLSMIGYMSVSGSCGRADEWERLTLCLAVPPPPSGRDGHRIIRRDVTVIQKEGKSQCFKCEVEQTDHQNDDFVAQEQDG